VAVERADEPIPAACTKVDIVDRLAALNGYRSYLELCTPTTGLFYARVRRSSFDVCHRLMYRCPDDFDDGMDVEFRSADRDIAECLEQIRKGRLRYDIILVDPWHEYDTSLRDLTEAFELVREGGTLVVHDCLPPTEASANPDGLWDPVAGGWAGVTHRAYVDFVSGRRGLTYYTIDTDWGCGVIRKLGGAADPTGAPSASQADMGALRGWRDWVVARWSAVGPHHRRAYRFLQRHRYTLLNLVTVDEFLAVGPDGHPRSGP
jgi:hypothetical protein